VGRIDRFCSRDRCNMPAGFGNRRGANQTCRAEQEEGIAVASRENFVVWAHCSSTVPDWGRDRQRARLSGAASKAPGCGRHRVEPAAKRAESPTGFPQRILEIERMIPKCRF
jgi:hypothetical protein